MTLPPLRVISEIPGLVFSRVMLSANLSWAEPTLAESRKLLILFDNFSLAEAYLFVRLCSLFNHDAPRGVASLVSQPNEITVSKVLIVLLY